MHPQGEERLLSLQVLKFSNQYLFYNDLFFSVIKTTISKNEEKAKYIRKNIITKAVSVFLRTINQISVRISSSRNFKLTENRVCSVWLAGSRDCPRKKIASEVRVIRVKKNTRRAISENSIFKPVVLIIIKPAKRRSRPNSINTTEYFLKSLT
jgi:hypothetical protein